MRLLPITCSLILGFASVSFADQWDKKTDITLNESIMIPGKILPAGKYVVKLLNSASDRHVVQFFNADQTKLEATVLAFNNERLEPTDHSVFRFWETPDGAPRAIRAWFYPGDNFGQEFAYPKSEADRLLAANNGVQAPYYNGDVNKDTVIQHPDTSASNTAPAPVAVAPAEPRPVEAPVVAAIQPQIAPQVTPAEPVLMAQNTEPVPQAAPLPAELPQTASSLPSFLLAGFGLFTLGEVIRRAYSVS